jgi:dihydrofolate reductase
MRKLILLEHMSLDGYLAGPGGEMRWIRFDEELAEHVHAAIDGCDTAIWGRVTYEMMAGYWPSAADEPGASAHDVNHGRWVNAATKLVFSRTLKRAPWGAHAEATVVREDAATAIARLKTQPGGDIVLIGSASLARACIADDLVDDYRVNVNPVVLGGGMPLFPEGANVRLRLVEARPLTSGVLALHYARAGTLP